VTIRSRPIDRMGLDHLRIVRFGRRRLVPPVLRVAEQQDVVRENGIARGEIREPPCHSDLVALKNPGITLDCSMSALASPCSAVLPLPKLPPLSPA